MPQAPMAGPHQPPPPPTKKSCMKPRHDTLRAITMHLRWIFAHIRGPFHLEYITYSSYRLRGVSSIL